MKVELCSALGTKDETPIWGTVQSCGESERTEKRPTYWTFFPIISHGCISWTVKISFVCFRVRTLSGNHTVGPVTRSGIRKGTDLLSASFTVSSSVQLISVWVQAQNSLGFAVSLPINYTLSDIGKTAAVSDCWSCEVHGIRLEVVLCFMCNSTTQVSHEITMTLRWKFICSVPFIWTAMPSAPDLSQPSCSSRECIIQVKQSVKTQNLEIQYSSEAQMWTSYPDSVRSCNHSDCSTKFRYF